MKKVTQADIRAWEEYLKDIKNSTPADKTKTPAEIEKHRKQLEKNPIEWIKFFFPKYASAEFADFQIKAIHRIINNPEWYEVLSWSRELAKSTITMFIVLYLVLTGKKSTVLLTSDTKDNAERLLAPYRANLEANGRIRQYYGEQFNLGNWTENEFTTKKGAAFRAIGAGQSPRGSRNEAIRPDILLMDDFDTDEECRNPEILKQKWDWFERAFYPTRSISVPTLVLWCGNIIAKDCCIKKAGEKADHWDIVNIRDEKGRSTWPQKNSEADIDRVLAPISTKSQQAEYFNNPLSEGSVFKNRKLGKIPPLNKFRFLVIYGDPTQSEAKGTAKYKKGSRKTVWLTGMIGDTLYVIKGFILNIRTNNDFLNFYFVLYQYVGGRVPVYCYMENNSLQDPFFQQVFSPLLTKMRKEKKINLSILPDEEKKTDKATRIDANLEPLDREGRLIFNEKEENDPHMIELLNEFEYFTPGLNYPADGVDCIEGGKRIIENKIQELAGTITVPIKTIRAKNRHRR